MSQQDLSPYVIGPNAARKVIRRRGSRGWQKLPRRVVLVRVWSRDCDHCESEHVKVLPATRRALEQLEDEQDKNAEGPYSITLITPDEAADIDPRVRDRILEAFEDGHPHIVYGGY